MFEIFPFILGAIVVMLVDTFWWHIDYKKAEKGMEAHEHYHVGIELIIVAMAVDFFNGAVSSFLYGAGFLFIAAEWRQAVEIVNKKVIAGHPFAYGSVHFKASSVIGIVLIIIAVSLYAYLPTILS